MSYKEMFRAKLNGNSCAAANEAVEAATGEKSWYVDESSWQAALKSGFAVVKDGVLIIYSDGV
ncbi:MAG TPA: hypothetical protein PLM07_18715 [Candidatus Rifleibacterium sp.]|nr:hypothetical protein [Candidatus Rifleibacterium sp.]